MDAVPGGAGCADLDLVPDTAEGARSSWLCCQRTRAPGSFLSRIERVLAPVRVPDLPEKDAEEDAPEEDQAELGDALLPTGPLRAVTAPASAERGVAENVSAEGVRELFSRIQVRPGADGKVIFEAPAQAATTLAALFEGMARMLSDASTPATPTG